MTKRKLKTSLVDKVSAKRGGEVYVLTALGLEVVRELALLHSPEDEIADYLGVPRKIFARMMDEEDPIYDPDAHEAIAEGLGEFKKRLRRQQLELAESNAVMAKHLGQQYLGQKDKSEVEHTHKHAVIGTLPNYDASSDDWKRQFAPQGVNKIEEQRRIEADVVDVEGEEVLVERDGKNA